MNALLSDPCCIALLVGAVIISIFTIARRLFGGSSSQDNRRK